jgi:addiction module HigA family antidote
MLEPIHPGEILFEEFMKPIKMSAAELAVVMDVSTEHVLRFIQGGTDVSLPTARALARQFGTSPEFWLNLQSHFDNQKKPG